MSIILGLFTCTAVLSGSTLGQVETCLHLTVVDDGPIVGLYVDLAYGPEGQPAVAYTGTDPAVVRLAIFDGRAWSVETIEEGGSYTAAVIAYDATGDPSVAYYEENTHEVRLARKQACVWSIETAAVATGASFISQLGLAYGPSDLPMISFGRGVATDEFWVTEFDGASWSEQLVDQDGFPTGLWSSLAFSPTGVPAVAFTLGFEYAVSFRMDTEWIQDEVFSTGSAVANFGFAFSPAGMPALAYHVHGVNELRYAVRTASGDWTTESVDAEGGDFVGINAHLAFDPEGQPIISYGGSAFFGPDELRVATRTDGDWEVEVVEAVEGVILETGLAIGPDGGWTVAYGDGEFETSGILRAAIHPAVANDCDDNGVTDACDLLAQPSADCNGNGTPDECDIASNASEDCNLNDLPDECDVSPLDVGTFMEPQAFAAGPGPFAFTLGDLNGDGMIDASATNSSSDTVSVLLNNGLDGSGGWLGFADPVAFDVGDFPVSILAADLDADGDLDLATANSGSDDVSVLLNTGLGEFVAGTVAPVGLSPQAVDVGDLDGDGDLDLVTANQDSDDLSLLFNNGDASFVLFASIPTGAEPEDVAIADLDLNDDLDLVVPNALTDSVATFLNNGDGTFAEPTEWNVGDQPVGVAANDLDSDGDFDLSVVNQSSNDVSVLLNDGAGLFSPAAAFAAGIGPRSVSGSDLDGDGHIDLVAANFDTGSLAVLFNDGSGAFCSSSELQVGLFPNALTVGDVDSDGFLDLVVVSNGLVNVLLNQGNPAFSEDCNANAGPDECDIEDGTSQDSNADGVPDECQECEGDANGDGMVDPLDSGFVLARFGCDVGAGDPNCDTADMNGDGLVNPLDVGFILARFGECP